MRLSKRPFIYPQLSLPTMEDQEVSSGGSAAEFSPMDPDMPLLALVKEAAELSRICGHAEKQSSQPISLIGESRRTSLSLAVLPFSLLCCVLVQYPIHCLLLPRPK